MHLASEYWQIDFAPEDQKKTALIISEGLLKLTRMPQGLCNASRILARNEFHQANVNLSCVLVYLDDNTVFSATLNNNLKHLKLIFLKLRGVELKLKPSKYNFFCDRFDFLGIKVSTTGIRPMYDKVEVINRIPSLTNMREVQVFLGMIVY